MQNASQPNQTASSEKVISIMVRSMNRSSLDHTLASIASQLHPRVEVLVISACGPHHRKLPAHAGPHPIRLIAPNTPLQRSAAANIGLNEAKGDYLMFLDDDDTIDPSHVSRLAAFLDTFPKDVVAVHTGIRVTGGEQASLAFDRPFNKFELLASNFIPIHAVLFKRIIIDNNLKFDEQFDRYEDWDFWLQISELGDIKFLPGISATYHQHTNNSHTSTDQPFFSSDFNLIYTKWWPRLNRNFRAELMHHIWEIHQKNDELQNISKNQSTLIEKLHPNLNTSLEEINQLKDDFRKIQDQLTNKHNCLVMAQKELEVTQRDLRAEQATLCAVLNSRSWRFTAPIRKMSHTWIEITRMFRRAFDIAPFHGGWLNLIRKAIRYASTNGWHHTLRRLKSPGLLAPTLPEQTYTRWIELYGQALSPAEASRALANIHHPLISVVMPTFNSNPAWLVAAVDSLRNQSYPYWELCIADDASTSLETRQTLSELENLDSRIHVHFRPTNGHISATSNDAINLASGSYIALLDHDDLLHPDALLHVAQALHTNPSAGLIYTDEDKITADGVTRYAPYFKTDWNRDLFLSHNLISHLGVYKTTLIHQIEGFRKGFEGSQDHDLALRVIELLNDEQIIHVPKVLYHWRSHETSTASSGNAKSYAINAGVKAVQEHLDRTRTRATASIDSTTGSHYRVRYDLPTPAPMVSIILPSRDAAHLIRTCVASLLAETDYPNFELIFVDNNTQDHDALSALATLARDTRVRIVRDPRSFNFSALCNLGVEHAKGEVLALVNNDVEVISKDWLREMVSIAQQPGVGAVGAKLWYPNDTLQHGGVLLGLGGVANHAHLGLAKGNPGYFGRAMTIQSFSAVTGACLVLNRAVYDSVNGLDEINLPVAFNDIDLCIRIRQQGFRNVWTPYAELYHHESATRGSDLSPEKRARFEREVGYMQDRWRTLLESDPNYNPNLSLADNAFDLAFPPRTPAWLEPITSPHDDSKAKA